MDGEQMYLFFTVTGSYCNFNENKSIEPAFRIM